MLAIYQSGGDRVTNQCEKSYPFSSVLIKNVYEKHFKNFKNVGFVLDRYIFHHKPGMMLSDNYLIQKKLD